MRRARVVVAKNIRNVVWIENSAWEVAEMLWPKQLKSLEKNVSDVAGLAACLLWQRLYDEKKLTKVSVEMLDDWMEKGYKLLDIDRFEACRIWMRVSIKKMNDEALALGERLKILEEAKKFPVIDGKNFDLDRRIFDLKKEMANLEAKR